jgi:predicted DNA-binding transcriptional regulator AlpA
MTDRTLLDRAQVAKRLGLTVETFYRNSATLRADGFPEPTLGRLSGARWDPAAIDAWLDHKIQTVVRTDPADTAEAERWAARLDDNVDHLFH